MKRYRYDIGEKLVYIRTESIRILTTNKVYTIEREYDLNSYYHYGIICDDLQSYRFNCGELESIFITLEDYRNSKLEEIGI